VNPKNFDLSDQANFNFQITDLLPYKDSKMDEILGEPSALHSYSDIEAPKLN